MTHRSEVVEPVPACDFVGKRTRIGMVGIRVNFDIEGVGRDLLGGRGRRGRCYGQDG